MPTSLEDTVETARARLDAESVPSRQIVTSLTSMMNQYEYSRLNQQSKLGVASNNQAQQLQPKIPASSPGRGNGDARVKYNGEMKDQDRLPKPKVILYPEDRIRLEWPQIRKIGSGLANLGNTCFINSILQCLTYTAPLVNYCLSDEHKKSCKQSEFCMICELEKHIKRVFERSGDVVAPHSILGKMKMIAKHLRRGDQEDAHEFLRYVVDKLHKACLNGHTKLDKYSRETTAVNHIFGGFLRSQVKCLVCGNTSDTFDPFMDLSLDIQGVDTIVEALKEYIQPDMLERDNAYMCLRCNKKVRAHKRLTIHKPPNVLTIQLKRFDYQYTIGKVTRHIRFPNTLNIRPFLSQNEGEPLIYTLYAVLVHSGVFCNKGHYFCYVKAPSQSWYLMNDSMVSPVSDYRVFNSEAYVLFYVKTPKTKKAVIGPMIPRDQKFFNQKKTKQFNQDNKNGGVSSNDEAGTPKPKQVKRAIIESGTPLPEKRPKVSFGLHAVRSMPVICESNDEKEKPRIVVHIKNGKVTAFEKSPDGQSKVVDDNAKLVNGSLKRRKSGLVPYGDSSDSSDEQTPKRKKHNGFHTHKNGDAITQNGKENSITHSKEHRGIITQNGKENRDAITQNWKESRDESTQNGKENRDLITHNGKNRDVITQNGKKDRDVIQNGKENKSIISQNGKENRDVIQNGKKDRDAIIQNGKENRDVIAQKGKENGIKFDIRLNATMSIPGTSRLQKTVNSSEDTPSKFNQLNLDLVKSDLCVTPSSSKSSQSSSTGSSSSSVSVNSTTEWQVTDDDEEFQHTKEPEMSHSGWQVSLPGDSNNIKTKTEKSKVKLMDKECTQNVGIVRNGVKDNDGNRNHSNSNKNPVQTKEKCSKDLDGNVIQGNLESSQTQSIEKCSKDHNDILIPRKLEGSQMQIKETSSKDYDSTVKQRNLEMDRMQIKEKFSKNHDSTVKQRNLEIDQMQIKEKCKDLDDTVKRSNSEMSIQNAETSNNLCLSANTSSMSMSGLEVFPVRDHKKSKKHKKHKKNEDHHKCKHHVSESDDCDHYGKRHKRKKHKHKHKKDKDHSCKKKRHHSDYSDNNEKKKPSDESSPEYVWVEKTKETIFKHDGLKNHESRNGIILSHTK